MKNSIEQYPQGIWDASEYFEQLTVTNRLAKSERFTFCHVSGLDGFEEALAHMQRTTAFVCVSDIANGFTELNNTPHTRRVKTVFLAKRHKIDDMAARTRCMETLRELFRQYMSLLRPCASSSASTCRCLFWRKPSWSSTASTSTRGYRSTRLTDTSSRAAPARIFK